MNSVHEQSALDLFEKTITQLPFDYLLKYPELQKRISSKQFEISAIHKMITSLKPETIDLLKQEFITCNNSVTLQQFFWLMCNCFEFYELQIPSSLNSMASSDKNLVNYQKQLKRYELEYQLIKIFEDIDIDESSQITWEEFIEYITCISLTEIENLGDDSECNSNITSKTIDGISREVEFTHTEATKFRKNTIKKIIELERHNKLAVIQKKMGNLNFINMDGSAVTKPLELVGIDYQKVLSLDYSEDDRLFGLILNNHMVVFVEDGEMQKNHGQNKFSGDQIDIIYLKTHRIWILVSMDQSIHVFKPPKGRIPTTNTPKVLLSFVPHPLKKKTAYKNHNGETIIGIKEIINPLGMCTGGINGQIRIWSLQTNQLLVELQPCKQQIVENAHTSLKGFEVFNQKLISYMLCWVFTNEISVWLPSASLSKPYLGKLKGHAGIVEDVKCFKNFPYALSIDNKTSVRLWNIRKLQCLQNWRLENTCNIFILETLPYALFYDKLISYYKIKCEDELQQIPKKMAIKTVVSGEDHSDNNLQSNKKHRFSKKAKIANGQINQSSFNRSKIRQGDDFHGNYRADDKDFIKQKDMFLTDMDSNEEEIAITQVLYDDYYDCLIILTEEQLKEISINNGKILNTIKPEKKNQAFLSMCLKQHRRVFIANNLGEISLHRIEDGSKLFTINIIKETQNIDFRKHLSNINNEFELYGIDYNIYNEVLLVIASWHSEALITAFRSDISHKKQIIMDQHNLCSFSSASRHNLFYVASNSPELVTIWDYHNIIPIRTIELPNPIKSITCETMIDNILIITENTGIRILKLSGIEPKNTTSLYREKGNFIRGELYIYDDSYNREKLMRSVFVAYEKKNIKKKMKVGFVDQQRDQSNGNTLRQFCGIYVQTLNKLILIDLSQYFEQSSVVPKQSNTPNIVKQQKNIDISITKLKSLEHERTFIEYQSMIAQSILNIKHKVCKIGCVNSMLYFTLISMDNKKNGTPTAVINFYDYKNSVVKGKLSLPTCDLVFWNICILLSNKIFQRMMKAEKISLQTQRGLKRGENYQKTIDFLRKAFFIKRYFNKQEDLNLFSGFLSKSEPSVSTIYTSEKINPGSILKSQKVEEKKSMLSDIIEELQKKEEKKKHLQRKEQAKRYNEESIQLKKQKDLESKKSTYVKKRSSSYGKLKQSSIDDIKYKEKMRKIEEKYTRAFSYLREKKGKAEAQEQNQQKTQEITPNKASGEISKNSSSTNFKIKLKSSQSAAKMYKNQINVVNQCVNKLSIISHGLKKKIEE